MISSKEAYDIAFAETSKEKFPRVISGLSDVGESYFVELMYNADDDYVAEKGYLIKKSDGSISEMAVLTAALKYMNASVPIDISGFQKAAS